MSSGEFYSKGLIMKRISRFPFIAGAVVAAVALVDIASISQCSAQSGPIFDSSGAYYAGYGPDYGRYSGAGYRPYAFRVGPGYDYPSTNAYGQRIPYVGAPGTTYYYFSNQTLPPYNPYGYGSRFNRGPRAYTPNGYGASRGYGY